MSGATKDEIVDLTGYPADLQRCGHQREFLSQHTGDLRPAEDPHRGPGVAQLP
jgi:hypothetical protein